jgi:aspartate-semialdehyde dehydrogenase
MSYRVAVVGATGAVGTEMLRQLDRRGFPARTIVPFASERSAGRELDGASEPVRALTADADVGGFDLALFSAGGARSRDWAPRFRDAGAVVVDNSSAWRMDPEVPLVVSEVNPEALDGHRGIVANPNCTTMICMLPLKALDAAFGLEAIVPTSFQAAGGAGQKGMDELYDQFEPLLADREALVVDGASARAKVDHAVHEDTLAMNVVPLLGAEDEHGYTDEELKLQNESRKILGLPGLRVSPTCVRVPVMVGHAIEVHARFREPVELDSARAALEAFPGLVLDHVPTPLEYAGRDEVAVGRLRADLSDPRALNFFVVGDNLLKGAALNTVQIAEALHERGLLAAAATGGLEAGVARG